jgi:hypothetical protein
MQNSEDHNFQETYYCNFHNPILQNLSKNILESKNNKAIKLFEFVRDNYPLCADGVKVKASETAEKGYGACWNKALLLTALLRNSLIPSRMVKIPLKREFLEPLIGDDVQFLNNPFYHCFVQMFIDDHWVFADPSLDSKSFNVLYRPLNVEWNITWDGKTDHIIHTDKILGPIEIIEDIDNSFNSGLGNQLTPESLIPVMNRKYWKKTGWDKGMENRARPVRSMMDNGKGGERS